MATEKQKKAFNLLVENGRNVSKAMKMAGYSDNTAVVPQKLTLSKGYQELAKPVIQQMEEARQRAINLLPKTENKAKYRDLHDGIDKLTKNIQLLSGKATERTEEYVNEEQIEELLKRRDNKAKEELKIEEGAS